MQIMALFELYKHYDKGFLFRAGSIEDQPVWYLDAMIIIDAAVSNMQREKQEEMKRK